MTTTMLFDLDHSKKRLEYYEAMKQKNAKSKALDKWIEIYSERVTKLERQVTKMGLRTQLDSSKQQALRA